MRQFIANLRLKQECKHLRTAEDILRGRAPLRAAYTCHGDNVELWVVAETIRDIRKRMELHYKNISEKIDA